MKNLPDIYFFDKKPFAWNSLTHQSASELLLLYSAGLGVEYSRVPSSTSGFKYLNRVNLNKFGYITSEFGINVVEEGLKNFQFRSDISGGYPGNAIIPYIPTINDVKQLAFMRPRTDTGTTVEPANIGHKRTQDANWKQMTPSWVDLDPSNFTRIIYCTSFSGSESTSLKSQCASYYGTAYNAEVMQNVYACPQYNESGKGMGVFGSLFGWGWDKTNSIYRLYRISRVFYEGNEIIEVQRKNSSGTNERLFCRYYNGSDCNVITLHSAGSQNEYLLCGIYNVDVIGGGTGGKSMSAPPAFASAYAGDSGAAISGTVKIRNGNYSAEVGFNSGTSYPVAGSGELGEGRAEGMTFVAASGGSSSFSNVFSAGTLTSASYSKEYTIESLSVVYGVKGGGQYVHNGYQGYYVSAKASGHSGPRGGTPGSSGGAFADNTGNHSQEPGSCGQVEVNYLRPFAE